MPALVQLKTCEAPLIRSELVIYKISYLRLIDEDLVLFLKERRTPFLV